MIVLKCIDFPDNKETINDGTIDIWFILDDGGLMLQIAYLLKMNQTWANLKIRLFTFAQETDNSIKLKQKLEECLHLLRIDAQVKVIEIVNILFIKFSVNMLEHVFFKKQFSIES